MEKDLNKTGNENVYSIEVEMAVLEHEDVLEACVFGVQNETWGAIKAVCVCNLTAYWN
jgi:fatty-acyl-CoA synthase